MVSHWVISSSIWNYSEATFIHSFIHLTGTRGASAMSQAQGEAMRLGIKWCWNNS